MPVGVSGSLLKTSISLPPKFAGQWWLTEYDDNWDETFLTELAQPEASAEANDVLENDRLLNYGSSKLQLFPSPCTLSVLSSHPAILLALL